jgi:hypothetical protein
VGVCVCVSGGWVGVSLWVSGCECVCESVGGGGCECVCVSVYVSSCVCVWMYGFGRVVARM